MLNINLLPADAHGVVPDNLPTVEDLLCYIGCETELEGCELALHECFLESALDYAKQFGAIEYGLYEGIVEYCPTDKLCLCTPNVRFEDEEHVYGVDTWVKAPDGSVIPMADFRYVSGTSCIHLCNRCQARCACSCGGCDFYEVKVIAGYKSLPKCVVVALLEIASAMLMSKKVSSILCTTSAGDCATKVIKSKKVGKYSVTYDTFNATKALIDKMGTGNLIDSISDASMCCLRKLSVAQPWL